MCIFRVSVPKEISNLHVSGGNRTAAKFLRSAGAQKAKILRGFSSTYVRETLSLLFDNQATETLIVRQVQPRVHFEDRQGSRSGAPHQVSVAFQIANFQRRQTALRRAEQVTRAA